MPKISVAGVEFKNPTQLFKAIGRRGNISATLLQQVYNNSYEEACMKFLDCSSTELPQILTEKKAAFLENEAKTKKEKVTRTPAKTILQNFVKDLVTEAVTSYLQDPKNEEKKAMAKALGFTAESIIALIRINKI